MSVVLAVLRAASMSAGSDRESCSALLRVAGEPLVVHAVRRLLVSEVVGRVVVEVDAADRAEVIVALAGFGEDRVGCVDSAQFALGEFLDDFPDADVLLVHDPAYALAGPEMVRRVVTAVRDGAEAVLPVLPCTDTVKQLDSEGVVVGMPDRSLLRVTQTPRGFSVAALRARSQEELLAQARMVAGDPQARRLSSGFDLTVAQAQFTAPV